MTLHFSIEYRTNWGESLEVELCFLSADGKTYRHRIPLETSDGLMWKGISILRARGEQFRYSYNIVPSSPSKGQSAWGETEQMRVLRREWDAVPRLFPADDARTYFLFDHWRDRPDDSYRYTAAYQIASGMEVRQAAGVALFPRTFLFRVQAPCLSAGERVALVGDQPSLGDWDVRRALPMTPSSQQEWLLSISADGLRLPFQYKYVVTGEKHSARWEEGDNRQCPSIVPEQNHVVCMMDGEVRLSSSPWKAAGLVVPLFSLKSEGSQGVGDFGDLEEMCDWAARAGMHAVQLLPINDTTQNRTPTDSYPYNAISVHALHPIYIDLRRLPLRDTKMLEKFKKRWQKLNALPALDYVEVIKMKEEYLHLLYEEKTLSNSPLKGEDSAKELPLKGAGGSWSWEGWSWLKPYQVFCHLRDTYGTARFSEWPELSVYNSDEVDAYVERHRHEVGYYAFVQHLLHCQLAEAADHARRLRIFLKGDLPIGISQQSVEAWHEPHLFNMNMTAGAPPDDFSPSGQNWGFPTYNWERMAADGYQWWRKRLQGMAQYFGAYRIDHILGFFRIWQIPKGNPDALLGQFSPALPLTKEEIASYGVTFRDELFVPHCQPGLFHPRIGVIGRDAWNALGSYEQNAFIRLYEDYFFRRHNDFWAAEAMKKLPALIDATNMLVCGEDLGMVPACVGPVMQKLGILSLEIQAMPKAYGVPFASLQENPYQSVDTIFTHDMPTLRGWWRENVRRSQLFYNNVLGHDGEAPADLTPELCEEVVAQHLGSPSMLCLISLQDWLSVDKDLRNPHPEEERINVPANPKNYWRYRMHLPISRLLSADALTDRLHSLISRSGRL